MAWPGIDQWLDGPHERELAPMSWDELAALAERRLGDRLAHLLAPAPHRSSTTTRSTRELRELAGGLRADARPAVQDDRLSRTATTTSASSPPLARGLRGGLHAAAPPHGPAPLDWPRVGVYHGDGRLPFRMKVSPASRRVRRTRAWALLDAALRTTRRRVSRIVR